MSQNSRIIDIRNSLEEARKALTSAGAMNQAIQEAQQEPLAGSSAPTAQLPRFSGPTPEVRRPSQIVSGQRVGAPPLIGKETTRESSEFGSEPEWDSSAKETKVEGLNPFGSTVTSEGKTPVVLGRGRVPSFVSPNQPSLSGAEKFAMSPKVYPTDPQQNIKPGGYESFTATGRPTEKEMVPFGSNPATEPGLPSFNSSAVSGGAATPTRSMTSGSVLKEKGQASPEALARVGGTQYASGPKTEWDLPPIMTPPSGSSAAKGLIIGPSMGFNNFGQHQEDNLDEYMGSPYEAKSKELQARGNRIKADLAELPCIFETLGEKETKKTKEDEQKRSDLNKKMRKIRSEWLRLHADLLEYQAKELRSSDSVQKSMSHGPGARHKAQPVAVKREPTPERSKQPAVKCELTPDKSKKPEVKREPTPLRNVRDVQSRQGSGRFRGNLGTEFDNGLFHKAIAFEDLVNRLLY